MRRALPLAIVAVIVIGACSDDGDGGSSLPEAVTTAGPATPESTAAAPEADSAAWCAAAADLNAELSAFQSVDPTDFAAVETQANRVDEALRGAGEAAPAELGADVETVTDAFRTLFAALAAVEYDFSRLDTAVVQALQADEALANLDEFNTSTCDLNSATLCRGLRATLEVAIDAFEATEGRPPADAQELVDAGLLEELPPELEVVDGEIVVAAGSSCS